MRGAGYRLRGKQRFEKKKKIVATPMKYKRKRAFHRAPIAGSTHASTGSHTQTDADTLKSERIHYHSGGKVYRSAGVSELLPLSESSSLSASSSLSVLSFPSASVLESPSDASAISSGDGDFTASSGVRSKFR